MSASEEEGRDRAALYARLVSAVVEDVRGLPEECCQSDGRFDNVWDEFVEQIRGKESFFFEAYVSTIRRICRSYIVRMEDPEKLLLRRGTASFIEKDDDNVSPDAGGLEEVLEDELYRRVCAAAELEEMPEEEEVDRSLYLYDRRGWAVISSATRLFRKAAGSPAVDPLRLITLGKVLHILERMPQVPEYDGDLGVEFSWPEEHINGSVTSRYFSFSMYGGEITLDYSGYYDNPGNGGDSFTCLRLELWPGSEADLTDHMDRYSRVPGILPLPEAVDELSLSEGPIDLDVTDEDDPFLAVSRDAP